MDKEELQAELDALFNPEPEKDGLYLPEYPHERIAKSHKLDISYMTRRDYEGYPYIHIPEFAVQMNIGSFLLVEIMMFLKDYLCLPCNYLEIV